MAPSLTVDSHVVFLVNTVFLSWWVAWSAAVWSTSVVIDILEHVLLWTGGGSFTYMNWAAILINVFCKPNNPAVTVKIVTGWFPWFALKDWTATDSFRLDDRFTRSTVWYMKLTWSWLADGIRVTSATRVMLHNGTDTCVFAFFAFFNFKCRAFEFLFLAYVIRSTAFVLF